MEFCYKNMKTRTIPLITGLEFMKPKKGYPRWYACCYGKFITVSPVWTKDKKREKEEKELIKRQVIALPKQRYKEELWWIQDRCLYETPVGKGRFGHWMRFSSRLFSPFLSNFLSLLLNVFLSISNSFWFLFFNLKSREGNSQTGHRMCSTNRLNVGQLLNESLHGCWGRTSCRMTTVGITVKFLRHVMKIITLRIYHCPERWNDS